jgi:CNT family concentrative nucleoside transporter
MLALLGIAWAMSYHRSRVRVRTVVWGLGLQLLFAVIILQEGNLSYVGMAVLGVLLVAYMLLEGGRAASTVVWGQVLGVVVVGGGVCWLLAWWRPVVIAPTLVLLAVAMVVNARFKLLGGARKWLGVAFVMLGVSWFPAHGVTGETVFEALSIKVAAFLSLSDYGARFLFGNLADADYFFTGPDAAWPGFGMQFAFKVLPTIIFFGGFMGVLYHLGIMQRVIEAMSRFMRWTIGTSGAETLSCTSNVFVGQTEAPLLIKPFLDGMTRSELLTIMVGGFATIAGGVLAGYIAMGIPAGHLIAASVMSAPAALVIGKLVFPETECSATAGEVKLPPIETGGNVVEAATNGITDGFKLALNVGAMLIGFIALIAVIDVILNWIDSIVDGAWLAGEYVRYGAGGMSPVVGEYVGWFPGSLQTLFGTVLRPLAWLMGVPWADASAVGNLLGIKLSLNEFVAYGVLTEYVAEEAISERSLVIATYALCGFANFSSIGIQIGGISAVAPGRKKDLAKLGLRAMFGGALASWLTATVAGLMIAG